MNSNSRSLENRRFFLRATGISMVLPLLESLGGRAFAQNAAVGSLADKSVSAERPMCMVCIGNLLGFYPPAFFPKKTGAEYELPESIEAVKPHQKDFKFYSGLDHCRVREWHSRRLPHVLDAQWHPRDADYYAQGFVSEAVHQ